MPLMEFFFTRLVTWLLVTKLSGRMNSTDVLNVWEISHGKSNSCDVLRAFYGNMNVCIKNKLMDTDGRILMLDTEIEGSEYFLINFYTANTEAERLILLMN